MARRTPGTSPEGMVEAMAAVSAPPLQPPAHCRMREADLLFWPAIVRARARGEWTDLDLVVAAQLARCQADIEAESEALDGESSVVENARGTPVANPRVQVLEALARREMALMRTLRMGGKVAGTAYTETGRRAAERAAAMALDESEDDDFLARPTPGGMQ